MIRKRAGRRISQGRRPRKSRNKSLNKNPSEIDESADFALSLILEFWIVHPHNLSVVV